jgi:glutamate---cysteine ligase / carboxylate-amine ligase
VNRPLPDWAEWPAGAADYTLGVEEEAMLLDPADWSLAHEIDRVLTEIEPELESHVTAETHKSALELRTGSHREVRSLAAEVFALRGRLDRSLRALGLRAAAAGTHPFAVWQETEVGTGARQRRVYDSMRALARREPTFGLHVHVGVSSPARAIELYNRLLPHLPLLLALSVNSPLWQGRATGLGSARTPLFQAFPRTGIPRPFGHYRDWVHAVDVLLRSDAFADPTFLWWDVRPQPRLGTVEVRILDAQTTTAETVALVALVQSLARLELSEGYAPRELLDMPEVIEENRFLAARDGMEAELIDPLLERRVPARGQLEQLVAACLPHARELGCEAELATVAALAERTGAQRQLHTWHSSGSLPALVESLAGEFLLAPGDAVFQVPDAGGRFDRPHGLEPGGGLPDVILEEPHPVAEEHRGDVDLKLLE